MPELTPAQRHVLLQPIKPSRVAELRGMSYVEAYDVAAHLTRIFGFEGWDKEILSLEPIAEDLMTWKNSQGAEKSGWDVGYRCTLRLTVRNPLGAVVTVKEDVATGSATHQPSRFDAHDLAVKSAVSDALKRCAKDLGDQFGLSLYDKGSTEPLVKRVVIYPQAPSDAPGPPQPLHSDAPGALSTPVYGDSGTPGPELIQASQRAAIFAIVRRHKLGESRDVAASILGHPVDSMTTVTRADASKVLAELHRIHPDADAPVEPPAGLFPGASQ